MLLTVLLASSFVSIIVFYGVAKMTFYAFLYIVVANLAIVA